MKRKIRSHIFCGRLFKVKDQRYLRKPDVAMCDHAKGIIQIPIDGDTLPELDWCTHESLHACCPWMAEDAVDEAATCIAKLLWRLGWRKEQEDK